LDFARTVIKQNLDFDKTVIYRLLNFDKAESGHLGDIVG